MILSGIVDGEMGQKLKQVIPITNIDMVKQLCSVVDAFLPLDVADEADIEAMFIYCAMWSMGAALIGRDRITFDAFLKKVCSEWPHLLHFVMFADNRCVLIYPFSLLCKCFDGCSKLARLCPTACCMTTSTT